MRASVYLKFGKYEIEVVQNRHGHFNSYVKDEHFAKDKGIDYETVGDCTYHEGFTVGFDTAHLYCDKMTEAEQFIDALRQAIDFINQHGNTYGGKEADNE